MSESTAWCFCRALRWRTGYRQETAPPGAFGRLSGCRRSWWEDGDSLSIRLGEWAIVPGVAHRLGCSSFTEGRKAVLKGVGLGLGQRAEWKSGPRTPSPPLYLSALLAPQIQNGAWAG